MITSMPSPSIGSASPEPEHRLGLADKRLPQGPILALVVEGAVELPGLRVHRPDWDHPPVQAMPGDLILVVGDEHRAGRSRTRHIPAAGR
jgi:hypothetical protein